MSGLFIVTVASEKGGVGKTTIATNLAVYLKALHEDLPVTIASFDNHFSVDQMFALGPRPARGISELLGGEPSPDLVSLGQYGVQYLASSRRLAASPHPPAWLRSRFDALGLEGILILDTRPILDWFTEAALLAADLVLTPVKDRAALVNAAALRGVLQEAGRADRLWLVPSLVDTRTRLNGKVRVGDFLVFAARERDYQVADLMISKSPRVESLASGFSARIPPVLTHARQTAVHGQLRQLAEFVLARRAAAPPPDPVAAPGPARRLVAECPLCLERSASGPGHRCVALARRRHGLLHRDCFAKLLAATGFDADGVDDGLLVLELYGPGMIGAEAELLLHLFDAGERLVAAGRVAAPDSGPFRDLVEGLTGRRWTATGRDWVVLDGAALPAGEPADRDRQQAFAARRRSVLRELRERRR